MRNTIHPNKYIIIYIYLLYQCNSWQIPPPPQTCCGSGCQNCVWIPYAEEITQYFQDGGHTARKMVLDQIEDVNIRAFVGMQLRLLQQAEECEKKET